MRRVVIVGASLAGLRAAQTLRREGFAGSLTVVGEERHLPYNRPPLSKTLLAGEVAHATLELARGDLDVTWRLGARAGSLDLARRAVGLADGSSLPFDGLVIATGAAPRRLQSAEDRGGVFVLRTLDDCLALRAALSLSRPRVVVAGAGFVGSEVASTCRALGLETVVVDPLPLPLAPLGATVGRVAAELQISHGVDLRLGRTIVAFEGRPGLRGVRLDDGTLIEAEVAVVGVGVLPATGWLEDSGLQLEDGVVCDETCAALGATGIVAAGDVARWPNRLFGSRTMRVEHWSNAVEQGMAAARTLLAAPGQAAPYSPVPSFWSDQFGAKLQSVGLPQLADDESIASGSPDDGRFVALFGRRGRLIGAVAVNSPARLPLLRRLVGERVAFESCIEELRAARP